MKLEDLGQAKKATIDKDNTTIVEGAGTSAGLRDARSRNRCDGSRRMPVEGSIVVQRVRELTGDEGFNAQTERYEDLVEAGVIDPTRVVRSALQNRRVDCVPLLPTEAVISLIPERDQSLNRRASMYDS